MIKRLVGERERQRERKKAHYCITIKTSSIFVRNSNILQEKNKRLSKNCLKGKYRQEEKNNS